MIFNMQCRPSCPNNDSTCSSFLSSHSDDTNTLNHRTCSPSFYHDQIPPVPSRRRRLEDPVITCASNYYVVDPRQTSHSLSSSSSSQSPPIPSPRRIHQQLEDKSIYCDLFNLLERPPPVKPRKKYTVHDSNSCRGHRSIIYKNTHAKLKDVNERKRYHQQQQQHNQLQEKNKNNKCIYQRHLSSTGFFRRVVRNYFCMPMTFTNGEFLN